MPEFATKNPLPAKKRDKLIEILQQRLADATDLQLQVKVAHWNVKGPHFISLHELFDDIYEKVAEMVDEIAERLVALGGQADGTVQSVAKSTSLKAYPKNASGGTAHVKAVSSVLAQFSKALLESVEKSSEIGDPATEDLFTGQIQVIDQYTWFVEAHLEKD